MYGPTEFAPSEYESRFTEAETAHDLALTATADEWYEYPGSAAERMPPYWVARHGTTVTSQIDGRDVETLDCPTLEHARAEFAEATCDPDGPGAPQPRDTIRVVYGDAEGERFTVASAEPRRREGGWTEFAVIGHRSGRPLTLTLGQFVIESRPAHLAATAADDETHDTDAA